MERRIDRDIPEACDEFIKVDPGPSTPNPSTACMCALKWVLCVGHVSDDGQTDR